MYVLEKKASLKINDPSISRSSKKNSKLNPKKVEEEKIKSINSQNKKQLYNRENEQRQKLALWQDNKWDRFLSKLNKKKGIDTNHLY